MGWDKAHNPSRWPAVYKGYVQGAVVRRTGRLADKEALEPPAHCQRKPGPSAGQEAGSAAFQCIRLPVHWHLHCNESGIATVPRRLFLLALKQTPDTPSRRHLLASTRKS